jgi:thiamine-phosphate pyrophosphorylase
MIAYAITDPSTLHFDHRFSSDLQRITQKADWLLYRDKENPNYRNNARRVAKAVEKIPDLKLFIHDDYLLAAELKTAGVHFSARGIKDLLKAKEEGLFVIASTHSIEEAAALAKKGVDAVTLSPVFPTPGKGSPLGLEYLREATRKLSVPLIALGGISDNEKVEQVNFPGVAGFASIRYFGE